MKKISAILILCLLGILFIAKTSASSRPEVDYNKSIRVGLRELYENVDSITINNTNLILGYTINEAFKEEAMFESKNGFSIIPVTENFAISNQSFSSYLECELKRTAFIEAGNKAYAASISPGEWKIFLGDLGENSKTQTLLGLDFEVQKDNGFRTMIRFNENARIILENFNHHTIFGTKDLAKGIPVIHLGQRSYRGKIEIGRYNKKGLTAINLVLLEDYLYGVLPSEMPSSWPIEALKAQAVSARSYALYNIAVNGKYRNEPYNLCDTTASQVYKGYTGETDSCKQAINETRNQSVYVGDQIIPAYFFSTSGGHTEDSQNVWSGEVSYLKGVPDLYETEPSLKPWTKAITALEIEAALERNGICIGKIQDVQITSYSNAGRAMSLKIIGAEGEYEIIKETMRSWLGLSSRKFTLVKSDYTPPRNYHIVNSQGAMKAKDTGLIMTIDGAMETSPLNVNNDQLIVYSKNNINAIPTINGEKDTYIFVGQGNGHGVGMSQSGAKGMAKAGFTYKEILEYYFTGAVVK